LSRSANGRYRLPANTPIEVDRVVGRDGVITSNNQTFAVHADLVGQRIALRLDGHLMHAIAQHTLVHTWPYPITLDKRLALKGARQATSPLPLAPPSQAPRAQRRVPHDGVVMVARQRLRIGTSHAGKTVTIIAEDTHFRIMDGEEVLAVHPRTTNRPVTRSKPGPNATEQGFPVNHVMRTKCQAFPETAH
jgi:hypothetical protein